MLNGLEAVMAWNVTADNWLPYRQLNTVGTLGLGIQSPLWNTTNVTFVNSDMGISYSFAIGQVTNWAAVSGEIFAAPNP